MAFSSPVALCGVASDPYPTSAWCGGAVILVLVGFVFAIIIGLRNLETDRWLKILLLRNGFESYYRSNGAWAALAKKHQRHRAQICLASPVIEMAGHQYMEVLFFDLWNILWPAFARCRFVVLRDAEQAEDDPEMIGRVLGLRLVLLAHADKDAVRSMKTVVRVRKIMLKCDFVPSNPASWGRYIDTDRLAHWYTEQQDHLQKFVSEDQLSAFLDEFYQVEQLLQKVSFETNRALTVQGLVRRQRCVSAETVMALETLVVHLAEEIEQVYRAFVASGELSVSLYNEMMGQRSIWRQDRALAHIYRQAKDNWLVIFIRAGQVDRPVENADAILQRSQRYIEVDARMRAVYALPLAKAPSWGHLSDYTLSDEQLDAVVHGLSASSLVERAG